MGLNEFEELQKIWLIWKVCIIFGGDFICIQFGRNIFGSWCSTGWKMSNLGIFWTEKVLVGQKRSFKVEIWISFIDIKMSTFRRGTNYITSLSHVLWRNFHIKPVKVDFLSVFWLVFWQIVKKTVFPDQVRIFL